VSTQDDSYTERLVKLSGSRIRRALNVQAPYGWNLRRIVKGEVLEIGCGIGRNLAHLNGNGVGIDHNASSVQVCIQRGFSAFTPDQFVQSEVVERSFETLLFAHVMEHMNVSDAEDLLNAYLPFLSPNGQVVLICPQERGYRSDTTHVHYFDVAGLTELVKVAGLRVVRTASFPLPRSLGRLFTHNETVVIASR
jgi:2-polyprenyl-3-methyl-5-hydroxy-6-metoxy-1,4-benzoquinol methylase